MTVCCAPAASSAASSSVACDTTVLVQSKEATGMGLPHVTFRLRAVTAAVVHARSSTPHRVMTMLPFTSLLQSSCVKAPMVEQLTLIVTFEYVTCAAVEAVQVHSLHILAADIVAAYSFEAPASIERFVKLYAKAARARLGWSGEEAQLFMLHVADLIEEADKHRRKLRNKEFALERICVHYTRAPPPPPAPPHAANSNSRPSAAAAATHAVGLPHIGRGIAEQREFVFDPATQIGVGIDPGVTQAVSAASGVWDPAIGQLIADQLDRWKLTKGQVKHASGLNYSCRDTERWLAPIKSHLQHLAAASSAGTSLVANLKHITVTLATWDAVWEVYLNPKRARQRLRLYGAQDRALEQFFKNLEEIMAEVSMERHGHAKQLVVVFCAAGIGRPRGTDQRQGRVVLVDEHRTSRVSSAVNGQQPCEEELDHEQPTRRAGWKPPAGQVEQRLLCPAWSQQRDQPVRGLMWCPVVAPHKPPQAPRSSQAATQVAASEPGPNTPPPAKRNKRTKAEQAAEPTQPTQPTKGKAAKAKPAPQPGRWLDRDCNAALNMQRVGESRWRPLELCYWPDQGALQAKGNEYPGLGYNRLRNKPPKAQQQQQHVAQ
ncbi:hypothetical protein QJQ45_010131 [Haematococcus lacustris]|nr:hypothetical protein QJQ45_010131 [Haematococcus lacustris]